MEPVNILSTATTTDWLLVPSTCSCMVAIFFGSLPLRIVSIEEGPLLVPLDERDSLGVLGLPMR